LSDTASIEKRLHCRLIAPMSHHGPKLDNGLPDEGSSVIELRPSQEQMRQLAASLQTAREEERADLARELHDDLGQTLTALKLELGRTAAALKDVRLDPPVMDRLQSLVGLVEIGVAMVKRLATKLRPPALDHLGLAEAIRWEAATFRSRSGLRCHVVAGKDQTALTAKQQTALFRIFQEALTNVARHAAATRVDINLDKRDDRLSLVIADNGKGIREGAHDVTSSAGCLGSGSPLGSIRARMLARLSTGLALRSRPRRVASLTVVEADGTALPSDLVGSLTGLRSRS